MRAIQVHSQVVVDFFSWENNEKAKSACNFTNESDPCKSNIIRDEHHSGNQVYP